MEVDTSPPCSVFLDKRSFKSSPGQPESASALKLTRTNCKPERMFAESLAPDGKAHCEVAHSEVEPVKASDEDLYVACFKLLPFTNRDPRRLHAVEDPHAQAFAEQRKHMEKRRPPAAMFLILDYEAVSPQVRRARKKHGQKFDKHFIVPCGDESRQWSDMVVS